MSSGDIVYSITTSIERKQHYTATISLIGNEGIIQQLPLTFSELVLCYDTIIFDGDIDTFDVQDCDVSSDQHTSSILVECTFAINSTAPGIVVIQDDQSQYTINKTLQRLLQDSDKGSVNITGLPAGEYCVRVYDNSPATDSTSTAYQHSQLKHIIELHQPSPTLSISAVVSGTMYCSIITALFILFLETFIAESFLVHTTVHNSATPFPMPAPSCMYNIS